MKFLFLLLVFAGSTVLAKAKIPADVLAVLERIQDCTHYADEDAYSKERAAEIAKAMRLLKCSSLEKDKEKLLKKYKGNGEIVKVIEFAD